MISTPLMRGFPARLLAHKRIRGPETPARTAVMVSRARTRQPCLWRWWRRWWWWWWWWWGPELSSGYRGSWSDSRCWCLSPGRAGCRTCSDSVRFDRLFNDDESLWLFHWLWFIHMCVCVCVCVWCSASLLAVVSQSHAVFDIRPHRITSVNSLSACWRSISASLMLWSTSRAYDLHISKERTLCKITFLMLVVDWCIVHFEINGIRTHTHIHAYKHSDTHTHTHCKTRSNNDTFSWNRFSRVSSHKNRVWNDFSRL